MNLQKIKIDISKYQKKDEKLCATFWQEFARNVCKDFNIVNNKSGKWATMIFQKAKINYPELKSKVDYCKERGISNGRYLIKMYSKKI